MKLRMVGSAFNKQDYRDEQLKTRQREVDLRLSVRFEKVCALSTKHVFSFL